MASPETASGTADSLTDPCAELSAAASTQCKGRIDDALCLFLRTHLCICKKESAQTASPELRRLDRLFAAEMVNVYRVFVNRKIDDKGWAELPWQWIKAFDLYLSDAPQLLVLA